jgi:hypothetical protein
MVTLEPTLAVRTSFREYSIPSLETHEKKRLFPLFQQAVMKATRKKLGVEVFYDRGSYFHLSEKKESSYLSVNNLCTNLK